LLIMFLTAAGLGGGTGAAAGAGAGVAAAGDALAGGGGSVAQPARQAAVSSNVDSEFVLSSRISSSDESIKRLNEIEETSLASAHVCFIVEHRSHKKILCAHHVTLCLIQVKHEPRRRNPYTANTTVHRGYLTPLKSCRQAVSRTACDNPSQRENSGALPWSRGWNAGHWRRGVVCLVY
jgi:hypothetical protein